MKSALVAARGTDKVYYVIDAPAGSRDGLVVRADGSSIPVYFFAWTSKARGLKPILTSKFSRSLWTAPKDPTRGKWYDTFIAKTSIVEDDMLEGVVLKTDGPQKKKKIESKVALVFNRQPQNKDILAALDSHRVVQSSAGMRSLRERDASWALTKALFRAKEGN